LETRKKFPHTQTHKYFRFIASPLLMMVSIGISIKEIAVSVEALNMELSSMEKRTSR